MILVGTAGYAYRDWRGVFYPPGLSDRELLPYYARRFDFVEINTTFYRLPDPETTARWRDQTPERFLFVVKAPRRFTHEREEATPERYREFRRALDPLVGAGRLGAVLAQFPSSFRRGDAARDHLRELRAALAGLPVAVEFRHREWVQDEATFRLLEEEGLAYVCVDEPQFRTLVPPVLRATAGFGYVRFHGRNYKKWWAHAQPDERYDYLYSEAELAEWAPRLRTLERAAGRVYATMNNHRRGQAAINGRMLKELLELGRVVTPVPALAGTGAEG